MPLAVEFRAAEFAVDGRRLVGPIDLGIVPGERLVVLGESGSGKTTTLRLVNRLAAPSRGAVLVEGRPTEAWDPVRLRRGIGYVIQEIGLLPHLDVAANIGLVPALEGWSDERIRGRVDELMAMIGLPRTDFARRMPAELSGGQRQRVGVARALAADPPLLLCDEPFGALDPRTRSQLQREFLDLVRRLGKTVLFVTHDVAEARLIADRIAVLRRGTLAFLGTPGEFAVAGDVAVRELRDGM